MLSAVAGISERNGGFRMVVGPLSEMHHHVNDGEILYVHPTIKINGLVPQENAPSLIKIMEEYVRIRKLFS